MKKILTSILSALFLTASAFACEGEALQSKIIIVTPLVNADGVVRSQPYVNTGKDIRIKEIEVVPGVVGYAPENLSANVVRRSDGSMLLRGVEPNSTLPDPKFKQSFYPDYFCLGHNDALTLNYVAGTANPSNSKAVFVVQIWYTCD